MSRSSSTVPAGSGEILARHPRHGRVFALAWRAGIFTRCECVSADAPPDLFFAPPIFDSQINGYGGVDFQQDGLSTGELLRATRALRRDGCPHFLLTLITDGWPKLTARLRHLARLRSAHPELQTAIAGWHVEGPFLSSQPGFCGAHDPRLMLDPTPEHFQELRRIVGAAPLVVTLSPERAGSLTAIRKAAGLGIRISLGHTNADAKTLANAVAAGAVGFTHLGNGCPRDWDRHDNILWRVLNSPFATGHATGPLIGLIPDGVHVSPALFKILHRNLAPGSIYYTTDAMAAAGSPPGQYRLGALTLEVGSDQIVRLPGTPYFAGSALRPFQAVQRATRMLDCAWPEVWPQVSTAPAALAGISNQIAVGAPAHFCLVRVGVDGTPAIERTYFSGEATFSEGAS